jgi:hypothetical protein
MQIKIGHLSTSLEAKAERLFDIVSTTFSPGKIPIVGKRCRSQGPLPNLGRFTVKFASPSYWRMAIRSETSGWFNSVLWIRIRSNPELFDQVGSESGMIGPFDK